MADAQNNSMTEYVIRTPGCAPHQQTPFISKFLAAETPPPLVTELVAGTCTEPSLKISGAQVDAARAALDSFSEKNRFFIDRGGVRTLTSKAFVLGDVMGFGKTAVLTTVLVETMYKNQNKIGKLGRHVILIPKIEHSTQFFDSIKPMLGLPVISAVLRKGSIPFYMDAKHVYTSVSVDADQTGENTVDENLVPAVGDGVLITTYLGLGRHSTGIATWVGGASAGTDTFFSFDESHHLKDLKTKSAAGAIEILNPFPLAHVIFSSATGAETISQFFLPGLRLGLWTESTFSKSITGGRNFFSYVGIQLYKEGSYLSRMLDTSVVSEEKRIVVSLSTEERAMYDSCARLMCKTMRSVSLYAFDDARTVSMRLYGVQICFFRELIVLVKMEKCIEEAKRMLRNNYAVAIAIQTTGEAWIDKSQKKSGAETGGDGDGDDDVGQGLLNILRGLFECVKTNDKTKAGWPMWDALWEEWLALGLPDRAVIDVVIDRLGGLDVVADATGRRRQFVRRASLGGIVVADAGSAEWVCKTRPVNEGEAERQAFQDAKKFCCVTSKKIAEGFNLHRVSVKNAFGEEISRKRGLIILDPPWAGLPLKQLIGRVGRTGQLSPPLVVFLDLADVIELSFAGRHASQSRNHSALTQGHMSVTSICDELSDLRATRGARAIRKTLFDIKDTTQYRTTDVREALGVGADAFWSYCERAVRSLTDASAISCLTEKRKAKRRRDGADDAGGDEDYDASEATSDADGEAVKQFLNRILSVELDVQRMLAKHLAYRLNCVQEQSSHLKPIAPSFNCFRTVSIIPGVELKFYLGLIPFDAVRALDALYPGGTLGVSPCFSKVAFVVKIRSVTWKITPIDVFARGAMPLSYDKVCFSDDGIRDIWQRGCSTKLMLHGLPVKDIHPLRKKLADELCSTTKMTLTRIDNEDGTPLIAFALDPDCVPFVKAYFSDSDAGSLGGAAEIPE